MYRTIFRYLAILFATVTLLGAENMRLIILDAGTDKGELKQEMQKAREKLSEDEILGRYIDKKSMAPKIVKTGDGYLLLLGPIKSESDTLSAYFRLKKFFPSAVLAPAEGVAQTARLQFVKSIPVPAPKEDTDILWMALFVLALIGVLGLYFSSENTRKITRQYEIIRRKQEEIEKKQNELFTELGENIYNMSRDVVSCTKNLISEVDTEKAGRKLQKVIRAENRIIDSTNNLLTFLKIKAGKIETREQSFNINNLLDDVVGPLSGKYAGNRTELIFSVAHDVPKLMIGDYGNSIEILRNLMDYAIDHTINGEVSMSVSSSKAGGDGAVILDITVAIEKNVIRDDCKVEECFVPYYDKQRGEYRRLELFVAYETARIIGGEVSIGEYDSEKVTLHTTLPMRLAKKEERRKYRLPSRDLINKNVFILDRNEKAAKAIKNLFTYFRHNVTIGDPKSFDPADANFMEYDILVIEEFFMDSELEKYINWVTKARDIKVVGIDSIFSEDDRYRDYSIFTRRVKKPLNQERVFELIKDLYGYSTAVLDDSQNPQSESDEDIYRFKKYVEEAENITLDSFGEFAGTELLIVEDNEINLNMVLKLLERSNMRITSARNGLEALEIIRDRGVDYFDIVLMDINMPVMDGYSATEEIRKIPGAEKLPIISLTALGLDNEIRKMKQCGMNAYLPKPISIGKMYSIFREFTSDSREIPVSPSSGENDNEMKKTVPLDEKVGLEHSNGNIILYREILKEFVDVYSGSPAVAETLYREGRHIQLKQLCLDIMGIAGSIGAIDLHQLAGHMYRLFLYDKLSLMPNYIKDFDMEMKRLVDAIGSYLSEGEDIC